ncbi:MAG: winged helix-turn-helix domain-containing protein [Saprospirales bacterium]|nr:winged helix-turn-helix domain-containing protein [Saprospirales bacterium]
MTSPKIVVYGNAGISQEQLHSLYTRQIEITPVPATYPTDRLDYLAPFDLVLLNSASESEDDLERIRALRRHYSSVPVILASDNPTASYLVQAYRYGITDCLLAPFNSDQLAALVSVYLKDPGGSIGHASMGLVPTAFQAPLAMPALDAQADLSASFLGTFRLFHRGERIDLPGGNRQRSLLAYLVYHAQQQVHRDRIIRRFWPDHDPDCAKNNLNVGICNLRRFLEPYFTQEVICFQNGYFFFNKELRIGRDIDVFTHAYHQGKDAERHGQDAEAAVWYRSAASMGTEFLEEFFGEEWTVRLREDFTEKLFSALDFLSTYQQKNRQYDAALETLRRMLYKDDCLESVHAKIMQCYLSLGKKEKAVRQYHECARILQEKLNMHPSTEMEALYRQAKGSE